jgi:hypothetical protein
MVFIAEFNRNFESISDELVLPIYAGAVVATKRIDFAMGRKLLMPLDSHRVGA